ncbi:MAG: hypothetical protein Q4G09_00240 [Clostridia bacterium]|nr:hypothetical protein [Clostridia bacterium]
MKRKMFKVRDFYCEFINKEMQHYVMSEEVEKNFNQIDIYIKKNNDYIRVKTLYVNKNSNIEETKKYIENVMCSEIGKVNNDGTIEKEYFRQGYIYKNYENFYKRKGKCYVSEYDDKIISEAGISYDGIYEEVCQYLNQFNIDFDKLPEKCIEEMVEDIFEAVDWQYTSSLINGDQYLFEYLCDFSNEYFINNEKDAELVER